MTQKHSPQGSGGQEADGKGSRKVGQDEKEKETRHLGPRRKMM